MAIYKPRRSPWPVAVLALFAGGLAGLLAGYLAFGTADPDPEAAAEVVRARLVNARGLVEVAAIEYAEAVGDAGVEQDSEYRGAIDALERARAEFDAVGTAIDMVAPSRASELRSAFGALAELMAAPAPVDEVEAAAAALEELLLPPG